jgi:hypothetical protein
METDMPDISIHDHGSILIFVPRTETGMEWMNDNLDRGAMRWAGGVVIQPHCAPAIVVGAQADGLRVES